MVPKTLRVSFCTQPESTRNCNFESEVNSVFELMIRLRCRPGVWIFLFLVAGNILANWPG